MVRIHAVLRAHGDDVVDHLILVYFNFFSISNSIKHHLILKGGLGVLTNFLTVLFGIVVFTGFGVVEVLLQLFFNNLFRYGNLNHLNELSQHLIACLCALLGDLGLGNLVLHVCLELINGIELRGKLRELVVNLRKFTLLNGGELHLNGCILPRVIAAGKRGLESCIFACRQAD